MNHKINIYELVNIRLELIDKFITTFRLDFEPNLSSKFLRGPVQKEILKKHNLPLTGPNKRLVNEALEKIGYKKVYQDGWACFRKKV